jgi:hypothetical protein
MFTVDAGQQGSRAAGHVQQVCQKQGGPPLTLSKVSHQQGREGEQPRSELARRHTRGKFSAGGRSAAFTGQPVSLVFRDERLNLRQFPDLMTEWFRIKACEPFATASALRRMSWNHFGTSFDRDKFTYGSLVSLLPATRLLGFRLSCWLCRRTSMRMHSRRRHGRILRREFLDLRLRLVNLSLHAGLRLIHLNQQRLDKRPHSRRHASDLPFVGDVRLDDHRIRPGPLDQVQSFPRGLLVPFIVDGNTCTVQSEHLANGPSDPARTASHERGSVREKIPLVIDSPSQSGNRLIPEFQPRIADR